MGVCLGPLSARPRARGTIGVGSRRLLTRASTYTLQPGIPSPGGPFTPPSPHRSDRQCRNVDRLAIGIGLRLSLRARLTLIRLALIRKPGPFGGRVSRPPCRYSCLHLLFRPLHRPSRGGFNAGRNAPLPVPTKPSAIQSFGGTLDARSLSTHGRSTSELLRTL